MKEDIRTNKRSKRQEEAERKKRKEENEKKSLVVQKVDFRSMTLGDEKACSHIVLASSGRSNNIIRPFEYSITGHMSMRVCVCVLFSLSLSLSLFASLSYGDGLKSRSRIQRP